MLDDWTIMNQYDTNPLSKQQRAWLKAWVFGIFIAVAGVALLALGGCSEKDPPPSVEDQLQGAWVRKWLTLTNTYNFHDGACDTYAIIPAQPVQYYAFAYTVNRDTLTMIDLASLLQTKAVVSFPTDTTAVLSFLGGPNYFLTRI